MAAEELLSRLKGVKRTGRGKWVARCPAHEDRSPSLAVREADDGRTLVHCFAGCDIASVLGSVGLDFEALFPARPAGPGAGANRDARPFIPADVFVVLRREIAVVFLVAQDMVARQVIDEPDLERLRQAVAKIERIAEVAYGG